MTYRRTQRACRFADRGKKNLRGGSRGWREPICPERLPLLVRGCSRVPRRVDPLSAISGTETNVCARVTEKQTSWFRLRCDSLHAQPPKARRVPIRGKRHHRWNKNRPTGESIKGFAPLCLSRSIFRRNPPPLLSPFENWSSTAVFSVFRECGSFGTTP